MNVLESLVFVYLWPQRLVAPIAMNFLQDFIGTVLLPWLRKDDARYQVKVIAF
jgi:hypothetical protein